MPPAFNLSQDQTLQFDLSRFHHSLDSSRRAPLTRNATATRSATFQSPTALASCECVQRRERPPKLARHKTPAPRGPRLSTHTYRLPIVKEQATLALSVEQSQRGAIVHRISTA